MNTRTETIKVVHTGLAVYSTLAAAALGAIFLSHWPTYNFFIRGGVELFWFYLAAVLLVVPIFFAEPDHALRFIRQPLFTWYVAYVLLGLLWLVLPQDFSASALDRWRPRIAGLAVFYCVGLLASGGNRKQIGSVVALFVLFACACTWYDTLRPYTFVPRDHEMAAGGRGAGLFINPNTAGSFIAAAASLALPFVPMTLRGPLIVCAAAGIVPTFSRSSYIYGMILLVAPIFLRLLNRTQAIFVLVVAPLLVVAAVASYDTLLAASDDRNLHNVVRRLEWFEGVGEEDEAVEGRLYGAKQAWAMFLGSPLTGGGMGATTSETVVGEGPHNMYLMLMAEQGFAGLALYLALIGTLFLHGRRTAAMAFDREGRDVGNSMVLFSLIVAAWGFFDHNVLEDPFTMYLIGFAAAAFYNVRRVYTPQKQGPTSAFRRPGTSSAAAGARAVAD
jgi:O-antigen ligase